MDVTALDQTLETPRLVLEPLLPRHAALLYQSLLDPTLYRFIPLDPPASRTALEQRYQALADRRSPDGREIWLNWAIRLQAPAAYIGTLQATVRSIGTADIAYMVFSPFQGRGCAREMCIRLIDHLFEVATLSTITALIDTRNVPSIRLVESLGFALVSTTKDADFFKGAASDEYCYQLDHATWKLIRSPR